METKALIKTGIVFAGMTLVFGLLALGSVASQRAKKSAPKPAAYSAPAPAAVGMLGAGAGLAAEKSGGWWDGAKKSLTAKVGGWLGDEPKAATGYRPPPAVPGAAPVVQSPAAVPAPTPAAVPSFAAKAADPAPTPAPAPAPAAVAATPAPVQATAPAAAPAPETAPVAVPVVDAAPAARPAPAPAAQKPKPTKGGTDELDKLMKNLDGILEN